MNGRLNHRGDLWLAGILSAIAFCLVVALGGSGGPWRAAAANIVTPVPHSGGMDVSHQPSTRFLLNSGRQVVVSVSKSDKGLAPDLGWDPHSALPPGETELLEYTPEKPFVSLVQHALKGKETSGYNARAPPALI